MIPASLTPPWLLAEKLKAYEKLVTTSHRHTGQTKVRACAAQPFFDTPPELTARDVELHGLVP